MTLTKMANFLLIHGAAHGAWCWNKVAPLLAADGHDVCAIDLPGAGQDTTPRAGIGMSDYVDAVCDALQPDTILVGHSFGGFPITLAAARRPEQVRALVYLCALVPRSGQAFSEFRAKAISPAVSDAQTIDRTEGTAVVIPEKAATVFYHDCSPADQAFAFANVTPQPLSVMTETVHFDVPVVPRHYIRCLDDRVVFPAYQKDVSADWTYTYDMADGHSPFLSDPVGLAAILNSVGDNA